MGPAVVVVAAVVVAGARVVLDVEAAVEVAELPPHPLTRRDAHDGDGEAGGAAAGAG
jgi:hypothetical protein